jgi:hypothetical protein
VRVRDHVLISAAAAALAAPFLGRGATGLLAGGVLIDADHYAWFCLRQRRLSPLAAVRFFNHADPPQDAETRALHAPAALLAAALLGTRYRWLRPTALGMVLHAVLDELHAVLLARTRAAALVRDGYACRVCGPATPAVCAHLYRQPAVLPSYRVRNLVSLCGPCHEAAHLPRGNSREGGVEWGATPWT